MFAHLSKRRVRFPRAPSVFDDCDRSNLAESSVRVLFICLRRHGRPFDAGLDLRPDPSPRAACTAADSGNDQSKLLLPAIRHRATILRAAHTIDFVRAFGQRLGASGWRADADSDVWSFVRHDGQPTRAGHIPASDTNHLRPPNLDSNFVRDFMSPVGVSLSVIHPLDQPRPPCR